MSKRQSMLPAAPPTPVHFAPSGSDGRSTAATVVLADAISFVGTFPVTLHADSVVHPRARVDARAGPVQIGRHCVVEERAILGEAAPGGPASASASAFASPDAPGPSAGPPTVTLGDYVSVETGAVVESGARIGAGSVVGVRSRVGAGAVIGKYCTLAPRSTIPAGTRIPDGTVVYADGRRRRDQRLAAVDARQRLQTRRIEVLRRLIPSVPDKYRGA